LFTSLLVIHSRIWQCMHNA